MGHMSEFYEHQGHTGPTLADWTGLTPLAAVRTEGACASSGVALRLGIMSVMSGMYDVVMVGGRRKNDS